MKKNARWRWCSGAVCALLLTACGGGAPTSTSPSSGQPVSTTAPVAGEIIGPGEGFAAGSVIGVSLPQTEESDEGALVERLFSDGLSAAGYRPVISFAGGEAAVQHNQIEALIAQGATVIVVDPLDVSGLGPPLEKAAKAGATIVAYDRLPLDTEFVDLYVAYDHCEAGRLQGEALLRGLGALMGAAPWTVEMIAGAPDEAGSRAFFQCAVEVLQPTIDSGTLRIPSGQTSLAQVSTADGTLAKVQARFDEILSDYYTGETVLDGLLSPEDALARAALASLAAAGKPVPVIPGQGVDIDWVYQIAAGTQYSMLNRDPGRLVATVVEIVNTLQKGAPISPSDTTTYDNGIKVVPAVLLTPVVVTQDNLCTAFDPDTPAGQVAATWNQCAPPAEEQNAVP